VATIFFKDLFIYLRERDRVCTHTGGGEGERAGRGDLWSGLPAELSTEPVMGLSLGTHEIRTHGITPWAETKSWTLKSHPGTL